LRIRLVQVLREKARHRGGHSSTERCGLLGRYCRGAYCALRILAQSGSDWYTRAVPAHPIPCEAAVYVAGHRGLVGSALVRRLRAAGFTNILGATRDQLDLRDQAAVNYWFKANKPEYVFLVAGTVGGILANSTRPAEFIYDNLMIHATIVQASRLNGVVRLLYLGSSCIYPRDCDQPIREEALLTGPLEPTNAPYALAKISGICLCRAYRRQYGCDFISAMPTNLYGPGDNFDLTSSHVVPALMRKFHEAKLSGAKEAIVWGTGTPRREFLHVDDLADACLFLMEHYDGDDHINVGTGEDLSIRELAEHVREIVAADVDIAFDSSKPDGAPRKLLDVGRLHRLGWRHQIELSEGLRSTYEWFCGQAAEVAFASRAVGRST
jgi:GDP-L-fucose synthase